MGVLEDVVIKAKGAADYAGKKTGEFVELSKLRISLSETEKKIAEEYRELGKMIYKAAKEQGDCTDYVREKSAAIDALFEEFTSISNKINELKNIKKCSQCNAINPEEADYCNKCGSKL